MCWQYQSVVVLMCVLVYLYVLHVNVQCELTLSTNSMYIAMFAGFDLNIVCIDLYCMLWYVLIGDSIDSGQYHFMIKFFSSTKIQFFSTLIQGLGFRFLVQGLGFRALYLRFRVYINCKIGGLQGLGLRVEGCPEKCENGEGKKIRMVIIS